MGTYYVGSRENAAFPIKEKVDSERSMGQISYDLVFWNRSSQVFSISVKRLYIHFPKIKSGMRNFQLLFFRIGRQPGLEVCTVQEVSRYNQIHVRISRGL